MDTIGKLKLKAKKWINEISNNKDEYEKFLNFSKNFYKYKTQEILGFYVQNPNATACADNKTWTKIGNEVTTTSEVIYAFDYAEQRLKYTKLYDISQVEGKVDVEKFRWKYKDSYEPTIKKYFKEPIEKIIEFNIDYKNVSEDDKQEFTKVVTQSTQYIINARCDIQNIELDFNYKILSKYFYEVSDNIGSIANPILKDIGNICNTKRVTKNKKSNISKITLEQVITKIDEVTDAIEINSDNTTTDYSDLIGRIFSFENRQYIISSADDMLVKAENMSNELDGIVIDEFSTEEVLNIINKTEKVSNLDTFSSVNNEIKKTEETILVETEEIEETILIEDVVDINIEIEESENINKTLREKLNENIEVIRTLKNIESVQRVATQNEKEILKGYHGFGGFPEVFDYNKNTYLEERKELLEILSPAEFKEIESSTLNAHYTSKEIIQTMYKSLAEIGFKGGKILEPSMGSGRFFEHMPKEYLENSNLYGVELDSITGKIAKAIYPGANIQIRGFEKTNFNDNYFDIVIGNIPFGNYGVYDKTYDNSSLMIHDYFIAKSLDKVKNGGIVAVVTSSGTLDKKGTSARELIAEKGALVGAIRLPSMAFKESANTEVVTDILFFQKGAEQTQDFINTTEIEVDNEYFNVNNYFYENPHMVIGDFKAVSGRFGDTLTVKLDDSKSFTDELKRVVEDIPKDIYNTQNNISYEVPIESNIVKLDGYEDVKNNCFIFHNNELYFKYNYGIVKDDLKGLRRERVVGQVELRKLVRDILEIQINDCSDEELTLKQNELNIKYDKFVKKYGSINSKANKNVFREDADAPLLLSIENIDSKKNAKKSNIFFERTIAPTQIIENAETPQEAMLVSLNNKGYIDIDYMAEMTECSREEIISTLKGQIYKNPMFDAGSNENEYETKARYLSGNVLRKLEIAKSLVSENVIYKENVEALQEVLPEKLTAEEIKISIGMQWIPVKYYKDFICEVLDINGYYKENLAIEYSTFNGSWFIDKVYVNNVLNTSTYGTKRVPALNIFEQTLNIKKIKVFDTIEEDGKKRQVLNAKATDSAQNKQQIMQDLFKSWIYKDEDRKVDIVDIYNRKFNNSVLEKFDGSHLSLYGMTNKINLRQHQKDAVYRIITKGNTLLSHEVGSGKTYTVVSAVMEQKRLGLVNKPMIVVPNHLVEQWSSEFMKLYPNANILAVSADDMSKQKRLAFVSKISTGNYDAIIISHSSFEKIPVSKEYRENMLNEEIYQIEKALETADDSRVTTKELNRILKTKRVQLEKLNDEDSKDTLLKFEELGVDSVFVDEAHLYKNLFTFTKLSRIAGVNTTRSKRATDMFLKCQLINKMQGTDRGVVFATGTPVSNSMTELYTMQRFLMLDKLKENELHHFDNWVANFGEITNKFELTPDGQGYKPRERLSTFVNTTELMKLYMNVADIITNDMINLELPKLKDNKIGIVSAKPSNELKQFTQDLVSRAKLISDGQVDPRDDNMLVVTNDGRKAGLDMRLIDKNYRDNPGSKVNLCIENVYNIWEETYTKKSTQLIFCDLSTPKTNSQDLKESEFNVYNDIRNKLISKGVPIEEIAYIHDCKTDEQKDTLFAKVRNGDVRILLGSTAKCGAGTNIQDKLIALHDLDCPWRPADLEQRMGRIVRQGNENKEVQVIRYVSEKSFDAYLWSIIETKAKFIQQILRGDLSVRSFSDDNDVILTYGEIIAITSGNPLMKMKMELLQKISRLENSKAQFIMENKSLNNIIENHPMKIQNLENTIKNINEDINTISKSSNNDILINGNYYEKPTLQGEMILSLSKDINLNKKIGEICGLDIKYVGRSSFIQSKTIALVGKYKMEIELDAGPISTVNKIKNSINEYVGTQKDLIDKLEKTKKEFISAKQNVNNKWDESDLKEAKEELEKITNLLETETKIEPTKQVQNEREIER